MALRRLAWSRVSLESRALAKSPDAPSSGGGTRPSSAVDTLLLRLCCPRPWTRGAPPAFTRGRFPVAGEWSWAGRAGVAAGARSAACFWMFLRAGDVEEVCAWEPGRRRALCDLGRPPCSRGNTPRGRGTAWCFTLIKPVCRTLGQEELTVWFPNGTISNDTPLLRELSCCSYACAYLFVLGVCTYLSVCGVWEVLTGGLGARGGGKTHRGQRESAHSPPCACVWTLP